MKQRSWACESAGHPLFCNCYPYHCRSDSDADTGKRVEVELPIDTTDEVDPSDHCTCDLCLGLTPEEEEEWLLR